MGGKLADLFGGWRRYTMSRAGAATSRDKLVLVKQRLDFVPVAATDLESGFIAKAEQKFTVAYRLNATDTFYIDDGRAMNTDKL